MTRTGPRNADDSVVASLLVQSLRGQSSIVSHATWDDVSASRLVLAASDHRIAPALHLALADSHLLPDQWRMRLEQLYHDQIIRHLRTSADLRWLVKVLDGAGIAWAALKGPVLSDVLWPRPDMREYFDLDVLVDRHAFGAVLDALTVAGASLLDRNWPLVHSQMRAELTVILPHGTPLDLHWDLVNNRRTRRQLSIPTEAMLDRRRNVQLGQARAPTLDAIDTLLHVALHAAHAGATRLMWLMDVFCAARVQDLDWRAVGDRANTSGLALTLNITLRHTAAALRTDCLPAREAWRPPSDPWAAIAAIARRLWPPPAVSENRHTGQLIFRSVRRSGISSAYTAARTLLRPPRALGDANTNPLHVDRPDKRARDRYLHIVETADKP